MLLLTEQLHRQNEGMEELEGGEAFVKIIVKILEYLFQN